ncbi:alpha/beta hydrolase [Microtetraspora sp. NBRC 16547]|uniref:alpha/beta fold hydrolase n=1 Tax=Microtetraspora sp. NBRC 16547 TaxID=3030993 RepID=UPI00249FEA06|nr:alpha/beta hydrolase [Microtetraspora sp. NBRC 16547]GLW99391.1 alpha/beta hydrolase [Microtetraspora sp. NBRC 16547]
MIDETTTTVNDLETRYLSGGTGPTVVFLHDGAWGASADVTWGEVAALAVRNYSVVAPDLLGFGGSAKSVRLDQAPFGFRLRHVFALLDQLGVTAPVHLVGNSFGGSLALRALTDPSVRPRIASVTTISGTGGPWRAAASAQLGPFDGTDADMARIVHLLCGDYDGAEAQVSGRMKWARMPGHYAATMAIHQAVPEPLRLARPADPYPQSLTGATTPVLLFECLDDVLVEVGWTKHVVEVLPQAKVVKVNRLHAPNITHPEQTWALISAFLEEVARG